jgi:hypothetical protein
MSKIYSIYASTCVPKIKLPTTNFCHMLLSLEKGPTLFLPFYLKGSLSFKGGISS